MRFILEPDVEKSNHFVFLPDQSSNSSGLIIQKSPPMVALVNNSR